MTANQFGIAVCTASKVINQVTKTIASVLGPKLIKLPDNTDEMRENVAEFEAKYGMMQCFGCIDGTHIKIRRPLENSQDYFCYKQYFSLNVQAVCNYRGLFLDVDCRWPGSVHDAKMFANSSICQKLKNNELARNFTSIIPGKNPVGTYLIGGPAYPLASFCIKEYQT